MFHFKFNLKQVILYGLFFFGLHGYGQLSKVHYIPPLTSSDEGNANPLDQYFYISTPNENLVSFTIIPAGTEPTSHIEGQVSRENPYRYTVSNSGYSHLIVNPNTTSRVQSNRGFIIEADAPIYVSVRMNAGGYAQAGALVSKGKNALGTEFRVGTYNNLGSPQSNYLNFASIMATEDDTRVDLSNNITSGLVIRNFGYNQFPIQNIILNKGDSYIVALKVTNDNGNVINPNRDGLIGTLISSDKPVVVNCGSANGSFGNGGARDYGFDQIVGADKIGNEYIFVRGDGQDSYENVLLVAHQDDTYIWLNDETNPVNGNPLAAGEHIVIEGNEYIGGNLYVRSSENVFAYQGIGGTSEANQGMFFVPPLSCENRGNIDNIAQIEDIGDIVYSGGITIVTKRNAEVKINETRIENLGSVQLFGPFDVSGKPDYITYKVRGLNGNISVSSSAELYAAYFNFNGSASSGSFYSGFPSPPDLDIDFNASTLGTCISPEGVSNVILNVSNEGNFDSLQWYKKKPLTNQNNPVSGANSSTFNPTEPGDYSVIGLIICSGTSYMSQIIPISICPPDFDQDGIIDNFDLDNDNDGILDQVESNNTVSVNLLDPLNPSSESDITLSSALVISGASGNSFIGTVAGFFESQLAPSMNSSSSYTLSMSQNVALKIIEDTTKNRVDNTEDYFIWSTPSDEDNISLWDPGDRLLVDTDFDGVYETGVLQFTGAEVRFKFNTNPINSTPFEFIAKNINGVTFEHYQKEPTIISSYFSRMELIDLFLDTDSDGLTDLFDSDSDGDGCYDLFEAGFGASDPDYDGLMGNSPVSFDLGTIDNRGRYIEHNYSLVPRRNDQVEFYFQIINEAPSIVTQPQPINSCGGFTSVFSTVATFIGTPFYQWQYNVSSTLWVDLADDAYFSGSNQATLTLINSEEFHSGNYRVLLTSSTYLCPISSDEVLLTVQQIIPPPLLNPLEVFCFDEFFPAQINDLSVLSTLTFDGIEWYLNDEGGTALSSTTILLQNQTYFAQFIDGNGCSSYERATTSVYIAPNPDIINPVFYIKQCDEDDENDGRTLLNLKEYGPYFSTNATSETFEFFTENDFNTNSIISSPTRFENEAFQQQVFVKIISPFNCTASATLDIRIGASTIDPNFMLYYALCDDDLANAQDGLATFSSQVMTEIKNTLIASDPKFTSQALSIELYGSLDNALTKTSPINISEPYTTQTSGEQEIWGNIESLDLDEVSCIGLKQIASLYVEPRPIANIVIIERACDGNSPLDEDAFDGIFPFDSSDLQSQLLGNQLNVQTFYYDSSGIEIGNLLPNPFLSASQTITVRLEKTSAFENVTNPDGNCIDTAYISFEVDPIPEFSAFIIPSECDNGENMTDGISFFNTQNIIDEIINNPAQETQNASNTTISFEYLNFNGELEITNQLPNPFFTSSQQVTVSLSRTLNQICSVTSNLNFVVNSIPVVDLNQEVIRCTNLDPEPIGFMSTYSDEYSYVWVYINPAGIRTDLSETSPNIYPDAEGNYEITATTTDGTNCSLTKVIRVTDSMAAVISSSDVTVSDLKPKEQNTITIKTDNLGNGAYEFSLNSEMGPYQDESFFDAVSSGPFELFIRDKNGCGTSLYESVILNYNPFFSPNGDGNNDTWFIEGISQFFQAFSTISIYDRYGKLLQNIDPLGPGWDGLYNDKQMPQDDYWFLYTSEEGRTVQGHFSLLR